MAPVKRWSGEIIVCVLLIASGCSGSTPPEQPEPLVLSFAENDGTVFFLRMKEVGPIIICCDIPGGAVEIKNSWSGPPPVGRAEGYAFAKDGRRMDFKLETTDGTRSVKFSVNGKEYDLAMGGLFLVRIKDKNTQVEQLKADLSAVPPDVESCKRFVRANPATSKLLGEGVD
jgi:hypothetical protein